LAHYVSFDPWRLIAEADAALAQLESATDEPFLDYENQTPGMIGDSNEEAALAEKLKTQFGAAGMKLIARQSKKRSGVKDLFKTEGSLYIDVLCVVYVCMCCVPVCACVCLYVCNLCVCVCVCCV